MVLFLRSTEFVLAKVVCVDFFFVTNRYWFETPPNKKRNFTKVDFSRICSFDLRFEVVLLFQPPKKTAKSFLLSLHRWQVVNWGWSLNSSCLHTSTSPHAHTTLDWIRFCSDLKKRKKSFSLTLFLGNGDLIFGKTEQTERKRNYLLFFLRIRHHPLGKWVWRSTARSSSCGFGWGELLAGCCSYHVVISALIFNAMVKTLIILIRM